MIYELRTYVAVQGRMSALNKRFAGVTIDAFRRHGIEVVGFWTNLVGGASDELIYMLGYESFADYERKWAAFGADPDRIAKFAESEKDGLVVARITTKFLRPTSYSPMK
jgi:hypothetical protein